MRVRAMFAMVGVLLIGCLALAPAAAAGGDHHDEEPSGPTTTVPPGAVGIGDELYLLGAVITPLDGGAARKLDAYQAAVFMQSWLAQAYWGPQGIKKDPPANLPVYRVDLDGFYVGSRGTVTVHYTDDGKTPYVAFPGLNPQATPDETLKPSNWFEAPARTIEAFNGKGKLVKTAGTTQATATTSDTTTSGPEQAAASDGDSGSGSSSSSPWVIVAVVAAVAVAVGGALWLRRRPAS